MALLHSQDNFQSIVVASDNKQERNYHLCPKKLQTIGSRTTLQQNFTKRYFIMYTMEEGEHCGEYMIYSIIMTDQSKSVNNERLNFFSSKLVTFFPSHSSRKYTYKLVQFVHLLRPKFLSLCIISNCQPNIQENGGFFSSNWF